MERTSIPLETLAEQFGRLEPAGLVHRGEATVAAPLETVAGLADSLKQALPITAIVQRHAVERLLEDGQLASIPVEPTPQAQAGTQVIDLIPHETTFAEADVDRVLGTVRAPHGRGSLPMASHAVSSRGLNGLAMK